MIWKTFIYKISKTIQELDLPDVDDNSLEEVRALLLPISESAIHSCNLVEEQPSSQNRSPEHLFLQARPLLPSPEDTADEEEVFANGKSAQARCSTLPVGSNSKIPEKVPLLLLQQTPDDEKFTFGSSIQSDIVLEASKESLEIGWVNLQHCVLYPDPDSTSMILHNPSRCEFWVRRLAAGNKMQVIKPGFKLLISEGAWHLNLGKGMDFQTRVLRHSERWNEIHNALMVSMEISTPYQRRMLRDRCQPTSSVQSQPEKPSRTARKARSAAPGGSQARRDRAVPQSSTEGHSDAHKRPNAVKVVASARKLARPRPPPDETVDESTQVLNESSTILQRGAPACTAPLYKKRSPSPTENSCQPSIYGRKSFQDTPLGRTDFSSVVKRTFADGTVHAVKLCRCSDLVNAAKLWKEEKRILKMLNHVRPASDLLKINSRKYRCQSSIYLDMTPFICL